MLRIGIIKVLRIQKSNSAEAHFSYLNQLKWNLCVVEIESTHCSVVHSGGSTAISDCTWKQRACYLTGHRAQNQSLQCGRVKASKTELWRALKLNANLLTLIWEKRSRLQGTQSSRSVSSVTLISLCFEHLLLLWSSPSQLFCVSLISDYFTLMVLCLCCFHGLFIGASEGRASRAPIRRFAGFSVQHVKVCLGKMLNPKLHLMHSCLC